MAFETIKELNAGKTISLNEVGQRLEGFYLGSKKVPGKFGESTLHIFEQANGENIGVWGTGRLNYALNSVLPVDGKAFMLRVTCKGTVPTKRGNDAYDYTVEIDRKRSTSAPLLGSDVDSEASEAVAYESSSSEVDSDQQDDFIEEPVLPAARVTSAPASAATAQQRDKVSAMLNGRVRR